MCGRSGKEGVPDGTQQKEGTSCGKQRVPDGT